MGTASTTPTAPLSSKDNLKRKTRREWSFGPLFGSLCSLFSSGLNLPVLSCSLIDVSVLPVTAGAVLQALPPDIVDRGTASGATSATPQCPLLLYRSWDGTERRRASQAFPATAVRQS